MASGLLEVAGVIEVSQFWPEGSSDADTTKIMVNVAPGAFRFRLHPGAPFTVTHAFETATVKGKTIKAAIENGNMTVRLQGIDAPELHYRPQAALRKSLRSEQQNALYLQWNEDYRQHLGETATVQLGQFLQAAGQNRLPCLVTTAVDEPDEVFDTYGRFVGDIVITVNNHDVNINTWLATEGWAFPTFYNSMSKEEIQRLTDAANSAWSQNRGVWPNQDDYARNFDFNLRYRRPSQHPIASAAADRGPVLLPKLFRRLSTWAVNRQAKMVSGSFLAYLRKKPDSVFLTDDFVGQGAAAEHRTLDEFVHADGFFELWPEQLVFKEEPSTLTGPGGSEVSW